MCKEHDNYVKNNVKHPLTQDQIKQIEENDKKAKEKQEAKKGNKPNIKHEIT